MTKWDLEQAFGNVDLRYVKSIRVFLKDLPSWRYIMKKSVKFAVTTAAVVLTIGFIAAVMFLQSGPKTADAPAAGSSGASEKKVLRVVTDLNKNWSGGWDIPLNKERADYDFQAILDYFGGLPDGIEAELEVLPTDEVELNTRLTRMKTEILAGGGPDVFLLSCDWPTTHWVNQERLFPNPEKAMYSDFFLPLDEYIENARFMEWEKLTPVIMDAGRTEEGQLLLPFSYQCEIIQAMEHIPEEELPKNWDEAVTSDNLMFQKGYACAAGYAFSSVFPKVVDNRTGKLLITEEELLARVKQSLSCPYLKSEVPAQAIDLFYSNMNSEGEEYSKEELENITFFPLRNTEGGVAAHIAYYGAVNRNTEYPQAAFDILDMFLSKQVQKRDFVGRTEGDPTDGRGHIYLFSNLHSVPVHEDLLMNSLNSADGFSMSPENFEIFCELRSQITTAYFPSVIDRAIGEMYDSCYDNDDGQFTYKVRSDEEVEKIVSDTYDKIGLMLGES